MTDFLTEKKHIHFIGIGGAGMYPLAQILRAKGFYITGSDNNDTDTLAAVRAMGIPVTLGHSPDNIKGADLIVHTAAIMPDNPELVAALQSGEYVIERSVLLGFISEQFNNGISIAGTHGKTTVTAMVTQILFEAGLDPSAVIGGRLKAIGGNGRVGAMDLFVCEACEYVDTFLKLSQAVSVVLNIDGDHMEYFKTMDNLIASFRKFCEAATDTVVYNGDDENTLDCIKGLEKNLVSFGFGAHNDYYPDNIVTEGMNISFDLIKSGKKLTEIHLTLAGRHNILNAVAAAACADYAGAASEQIAFGLKNFRGAGRRFEYLGEVHGAVVVDDYAHHPKEIEVTLNAAKTLGYRRIRAIFQPFTFSRTSMLLNDFAKALSLADEVILTPIMGSREKNTYGISSLDLKNQIEGCWLFDSFEEIAGFIKETSEPGDLVITLGCGDVYKIAKMLVK